MGEVLDLQKKWTARKTEAMERRGKIVRDEILVWLLPLTTTLAAYIGMLAWACAGLARCRANRIC